MEKCRERDFENFKPQEFSNVINGLAKFEQSAGEAFLEAFTEKSLFSRPRQHPERPGQLPLSPGQ
jgi:hypothetical protein